MENKFNFSAYGISAETRDKLEKIVLADDCADLAIIEPVGGSECVAERVIDNKYSAIIAPVGMPVADIKARLEKNIPPVIHSTFADVKENTQKAQTTLEDITKAYADFANANLKMLNDLEENRKFPGYTVGDFMKEVSKYRDIRWKDKGNENDILSLSDVLNLCYQIFSV